MMHESQEPKQWDAEQLNRLIRDCRTVAGELSDRPNSDCVAAYIMGHATEEQRAKMVHAMASSKEFRKDTLALIEEYDSVFDVDGDADNKNSSQGEQRSILSRGSSWIWASAAALVLVVTGFLYLEVYISSGPVGDWHLVSENIENAVFISNAPRGGIADVLTQEPFDAAMAGFRAMLEVKRGRLITIPDSIRASSPATNYAELRFATNPPEGARQVVICHLVDSPTELDSALLWILDRKTRQLYQTEFVGGRETILWPPTDPQQSSLVLTYRVPDGYAVVIGQLRLD